MNRKKMQHGMGAIEIIEEAVHLLRLSPASVLSSYYIGSLPFFLALLYFWADMSRNVFAENYCTIASLGLAGLFVWMKCWHAVFAQKLRARISHQSPPRWSFRRIVHLVTTQTPIQASGLAVLPLSLLIAIPFGWSYAFYQNVSVLNDEENDGIRSVFNKSWQQAQRHPGQNHMLISIFFIFGIVIFLNLTFAIFLAPHMLKKFLGIDSMFTMSGFWVFNTTFFATASCMTFLCIDPLIKAVYTLRCFYGASVLSGEDIKAELKRFQLHNKLLSAIVFFFLSLTPFFPLTAAEYAAAPTTEYGSQNSAVSSEELNRSIEEIMERREFTWRMPREKFPKEENKQMGPIAQLMEWIVQALKKVAKTIVDWIDAVVEWLNDLLPEPNSSREASGADWMRSARGLLYVLLVVLVCILGIIFWRIWQRRKQRHVAAVSEPVSPMPDLTDDQIDAGELPANRWLSLAKELMKEGSLTLALRALYLATLAHLAEQDMVTIAKHKSNREYERELNRRAHEHKDLLGLFSRNVKVFDKSWYGMYEVKQEDLNLFVENQERIMAFVKE